MAGTGLATTLSAGEALPPPAVEPPSRPSVTAETTPDEARSDETLPADAVPTVGGRATLQTVSITTLAVIAVLAVMSVAADIVVPLVMAVVLKLVLQPAMRFLTNKAHVPVLLAALLLMMTLFGVITAIVLSIAVPASGWISKAPEGIRILQQQIHGLQAPLDSLRTIVKDAEESAASMASSVGSPAAAQAAGGDKSGLPLQAVGMSLLAGTQYFFGRLFEFIVALFFMLAAGDSMLRKLVEVVPRFHEKKHVVFITNEIERNVSRYLATITVVNLAFGVIAGLALWLCHFSDPLLWGTVIFLLNYVPIIGPLIGITLIFVVGLMTYGHGLPALLPASIYLALHITEGQIVTPMLLARQFTLSPLVVIISLFFWNWMWGIPGALLSVPLLAMFKIVCDRIPSLAALGHMLGEPNQRGSSGEKSADA